MRLHSAFTPSLYRKIYGKDCAGMRRPHRSYPQRAFGPDRPPHPNWRSGPQIPPKASTYSSQRSSPRDEKGVKKRANSIQRYMSGCILLDIILVDGVRAEAKLTHSDEYRRLYATCLAMAKQSNLPEVRARWLTLAKDCKDLLGGPSATDRRSKSLSARLGTRAAANLSGA
jgi:hypothetical protein